MSTITISSTSKVVGLLVAVMLLFGLVAVPAANAITLAELVELFIALEIIPPDKAAAARAVLTDDSSSSSSVCPFTWSSNLNIGATGDDVWKLQMFLNDELSGGIASSGAGSPGSETSFYGSITGNGVKRFQEKYTADVLTPVGLSSGTLFFGPSTRAKANGLCASAPVVTPPVVDGTADDIVVVVGGTGLTVTKHPNQPEDQLAPQDASRVPFTKIQLTASSDGDVTVNSINVRRNGIAADSSFAGLVLMNDDGTLIGTEKTLNSNSEAKLGTAFVVAAGTTRNVTIVARMDADLSQERGEQPTISVIAINTSATVHGSLPIVGAKHTINSSLSIGSVTMLRGSLDPGTGLTKEVGTKDFKMSGIKITAGSSEDLKVKSIRWYQSASAATEDLDNVVTIIDGVDYETTVDGKLNLGERNT